MRVYAKSITTLCILVISMAGVFVSQAANAATCTCELRLRTNPYLDTGMESCVLMEHEISIPSPVASVRGMAGGLAAIVVAPPGDMPDVSLGTQDAACYQTFSDLRLYDAEENQILLGANSEIIDYIGALSPVGDDPNAPYITDEASCRNVNKEFEFGSTAIASIANCVADGIAAPTASGNLTVQIAPVPLPNPLGEGRTNIAQIVGQALGVVMGVLGAITLFVFIDGAWNWITGAGYPQRIQKGIRTMLFAVAGLFVIFAAYGILNAFIGALSGS